MVLVDPPHEDQFLRYPETWRQMGGKVVKQTTWIMRLLGILNSIGLLALARGPLGKWLPFPLPEGTRETYLGVVCFDTGFFETTIEENACAEETMGLLRAARSATLGDIPLIVLSAGQIIPESQIKALERRGLLAEDAQQVQSTHDEMHAELAKLSLNGRLVMVEESGHDIHLDQPELVIDAIRQVVEAARR
jgi:pimeloyl-ACP methyl ester carboxylesterase